MHILKSLYLSKNSVLEVRDKIMREEKNGEKNKSWEINGESREEEINRGRKCR